MTLSEIEERLDALDNRIESTAFARAVLLRAAEKICEGDTSPVMPTMEQMDGYAPQMSRSGRVEYDHQVEGTE